MLPGLRSQLDTLIGKRSRFEAETRGLTEGQVRFRPAAGSWSIAEVAQHLLQVEREVTRAVTKPGVRRTARRRTPRELLGYLAFLVITKRGYRVKVPREVAGLVTPATHPAMDLLWAEWSEVHSRLERYLDSVGVETLGEMAFRHPIIGPVSVRGLLPFFIRHFDHHMRQVGRIRRAPGFADA